MSSQQVSPKEHLENSLEFIRTQEAKMRHALQSPQGRLLVAIKNASQMLGELRTSSLPPKPYYELYNACFDALTLLQGYMREAHRNHHLADVYEVVEYTGNVLPRLYLMITVGTAYLGSGDAPNQDVLKDMLEMSRGVQHPLRGLFLRYYLGQRTRDFLATASRADLKFSIHFTLTNFVEMNKMWVRYQHMGHSRESSKRLEERHQLQTVVGSSIYRLAQLDAVDLAAFRDLVLPAVLEQVIQCRDPLAQEYLLDVVSQAFPAEYHLDTLPQYFNCVSALVPQTNRRVVILASINRVIEHAKETKEEREAEAETKVEATASLAEALPSGEGESAQPDPAHDSPEPAGQSRAAEPEKGASAPEADEKAETQSDATTALSPESAEPKAETEAEAEAEIEAASSSEAAEAEAETEVKVEAETEAEVKAESATPGAKEGSPEQIKPENATAEQASASDKTVQTTAEEAETEKAPSAPESSVNAITEQTAELSLSAKDKSSEATRNSQYESALELYWHFMSQLELSATDRAAIVHKLIELSELTGGDDVVPLRTLLEYVVKGELQPSAEVERLVLALFDQTSSYSLSEVLAILKHLPQLLASQSKEARHAVATKVLDNMVASATVISDTEEAKQVFALFGMLLKSGDLDPTKITQLVHLLHSDDGNTSLDLLNLTYRTLRDGGAGVVKKTFGVLVNAALMLLHGEAPPALVGKTLKFVNKVCHDLTTLGDSPLASYRLYLLAVSAADYIGAEEAAYELFVEALTTYEDHISDSRQQVAALAIAIQSLQRASVFTVENFEPLAQRCQQSSQRLLKKPDQCHTLLLVAALFWDNNYANAKRVSETLSKALRIADAVIDAKISLELFLDVLDSNLYFLGADVPTVTTEEVNSLIELIKQNFEAAQADDSSDTLTMLRARLDRTIRFVRVQENEIVSYQSLVF